MNSTVCISKDEHEKWGSGCGGRTNPQNCCNPCNMHTTANALLPCPSRQKSSHLSHHPTPPSSSSLALLTPSSISLNLLPTSPPTPASSCSPITLLSTSRASFLLPRMTNHLGLSGCQTNPTPCTTAGTAPSPTPTRHPRPSVKTSELHHPTAYASNCPPVIHPVYRVVSLPR